MITEDKLWKSIIEDLAVEFIALTYPEAHKTLNLKIKPEFLDKELEQIFTDENKNASTKIADKLIKVYTLQGEGDFVIFHIEVQAKYSTDFGRRMMTYFCRIWDKYQKPITALAIFTENISKERSGSYLLEFMGTGLNYNFNTYKIEKQPYNKLAEHVNPFAMVIAAAKLKGEGRVIKDPIERDDFALVKKIELIRQLKEKHLNPEIDKILFRFINNYIHLENENNKVKFANEVVKLTGIRNIMGIEELIISEAKIEARIEGLSEGRLEGKRQGILEGKLEGKLEAKLEIAVQMKKKGLSIAQIAEFTNLPIDKIEKAIALAEIE